MREVNFVTQTNGIGVWTSFRKKVTITKLEHEEDSVELRAYFNTNEWDTYEHGVIYTDEGWLETFKQNLTQLGIKSDGITYSPYGLQGEDFVALDVPDDFSLL